MDERMKFIARLLEGDSMTEVCEVFGISRKTGYKIWDRYQTCGVQGLTDRSRRPIRYANQLPMQIEQTILNIRRDKPTWGARKIREKIHRKYPDIHMPATSTIHAVLDRHGLVQSRKRVRKHKPEGTTLSYGKNPNELWCADYKGEFMLGNKQYCYPLTITDFASRYLFACEAQESTQERRAEPKDVVLPCAQDEVDLSHDEHVQSRGQSEVSHRRMLGTCQRADSNQISS